MNNEMKINVCYLLMVEPEHFVFETWDENINGIKSDKLYFNGMYTIYYNSKNIKFSKINMLLFLYQQLKEKDKNKFKYLFSDEINKIRLKKLKKI